MKKFNLLIAAGLLATASVSAQTTIASVGFESGDKKYTTETAYTPGGTYGNWVNRQEGDVWNEQYADETHSGEFAFQMQNDPDHAGARWERGFVIGNLQLKDNTAYRVSFWVKGPEGKSVKSSINIGHEYCDKAIGTASGQEYLYDYAGALTGDWQRFSYVTFFTNKADQDAYAENYADKEDPNGEKPMPAGSVFPEEYNVIFNLYNGGEYILDDISVEEGVTFNQATFVDDVIKLDFGYPTNIADLAKANGGVLSLDPSCVSVTIDGEAAPVEFVEGKEDGFLYIFLDSTMAEETSKVVVSFTPAADCPILYSDDKRPSADVESEMKVLGFTAETAYFDSTIDALPAAWAPAEMVSSNPENESFEIVGATFKNIAITYNKAVSLDYASATLSKNGVNTDLTSAMSLSEDGLTVNTAVSGLADGEYTFTLSGVANSYGIDCLTDQVITFALGEDTDTSVSEEVFATDFDNQMTGGIPEGWVTYNEAGFHLYGFNDEERTSQYNYNWGGTPGGGGARLYDGFSGDFTKAMYWGTRGTNEGYAEFGTQVKDWMLSDGTLDPEMPEGVALKLEPRKYQISFLMAAWKNAPKFTFTLEDLEGNVYAKFADITAAPTLAYHDDASNSDKRYNDGKVTGSVKCTTDFTVDKEGYYVLRFTSAEAQWQEFCLANVKLVTMPSKAAYWKQQLAAAVEKAEPIMESAKESEYDGETKTAFAAALDNAKNGHFTSPSEITALIEELDELGTKMQARVSNIDDFNIAIIEAEASYGELEGKYLEVAEAKEAKSLIDGYATTNPSELSDEELAEVTPKLVTVSSKVKNVKACTDRLTWGIYKANQTATKLGTADTDAINAGWNAVSDDREVAANLNAANKMRLYEHIMNGELADSIMTELYDNQNADSLVTKGVEMTGYIQNPKFYRIFGDDARFAGWTIEGNTPGMNGAPSEAEYVIDSSISSWGNNDYDLSQTITGLPAGIYDVEIDTRTVSTSPEVSLYGYNAQNDETGEWDMYSYAQGDADAEKSVKPYRQGASFSNPVGVIKGIQVKDGTLTFGTHEKYVSGKAVNASGEATDFWTGTSQVANARLFFVAPLEGFDYATALSEMVTAIEVIEAAPAAQNNAIYNLAGQRVDANYKGIVIKNGKKVLVK